MDAAALLIKTLFASMLCSLALVTLVLLLIGLWFGQKMRVSLTGAISSAWGPAALLCLMSTLKMPITVVSCVVLSVLIGMTGDNLVQYLFAGGNQGVRAGLGQMAKASIRCSSIMMGVSILLAGSTIRDLRSLGVLLAAGFLLSLIGDIWVFQGILPSKTIAF